MDVDELLAECALTASFVREQTLAPVMVSGDDIDYIRLEVPLVHRYGIRSRASRGSPVHRCEWRKLQPGCELQAAGARDPRRGRKWSAFSRPTIPSPPSDLASHPQGGPHTAPPPGPRSPRTCPSGPPRGSAWPATSPSRSDAASGRPPANPPPPFPSPGRCVGPLHPFTFRGSYGRDLNSLSLLIYSKKKIILNESRAGYARLSLDAVVRHGVHPISGFPRVADPRRGAGATC